MLYKGCIGDKGCTFHLGDYLNFLCDSYLQCSKGFFSRCCSWGTVFQKKCSFLRFWVDNTSSLFYGQSILTPNLASHSSGPFFLSSSLQLIAYSLVSVIVFVSKHTFMQQNFAYNVGLISTYSAHKYSTFSRFLLASNLRQVFLFLCSTCQTKSCPLSAGISIWLSFTVTGTPRRNPCVL